MRKLLLAVCAASLVLSTACTKKSESAAAKAPAAPAVANAATISGVTRLQGSAPTMPFLPMDADPYCQSSHPQPVRDEEVVVDPAGDLANVIVYVKNAKPVAPPATPAVLDQKGCMYRPHVLVVQVGQPLEIRNSDQTMHNVDGQASENPQFNEGQPMPMTSTRTFEKPELTPFKVKCDVHGWMKAWVAVLPHPYHSVSQPNGSFSISNLPPGTYTLVAWHEKYGQQELQVTVGANETKQVTFTFKG